MEKTKKIAVIAVFALMIFGLAIAHWLLPDAQYSDTERRALEQKPDLSSKAVFDGSYASEMETYLLEQFPLRDSFRGVKTVVNTHLWNLRDTNGYYYADGHWMELDETLDEKQVSFAVNKFNTILENHPQIANAYYAIVPDKNYFLAEENGYFAMDYDKLYALMENMNAQGIDLRAALSIDDYYRTDSHWRQERLQSVVQTLCEAMDVSAMPLDACEKITLEDFAGVYADHTAYPFISEELCYLEHASMQGMTVQKLDSIKIKWIEMPMYDTAAYQGVDPYDVYLSGAQPLIRIENPNAENDKHLILFRDSFGSSLAPLLSASYAKVTLVDLRYFASIFLDAYLDTENGKFVMADQINAVTAELDRLVDFENADVLFLFSTTLLNSAGGVLK